MSIVGGRNRKEPPSATEPLTYLEVYRLVKEKKIHLAEDLYELAQQKSEVGEHGLLLFCTGAKGKKMNLQTTIDTIWTPDPGAVSANPRGAEAAHRNKISSDAVERLKALARRPPPKQDGIPEVIKYERATGLKKIKDLTDKGRGRGRGSGQGQTQEVHLFDQFGHQAEIIFRPRGGLWRLRDFYEVLAACSQEPDLLKTSPNKAGGGFLIPRSEAGWHSMLRAGVATPRIPFAQLTEEQLKAASGQIRFGFACGDLTWKVPQRLLKSDEWIDFLPEDEKFEVDSLAGSLAEERLVRLFARNHVEGKQLRAMVRVLEACQHAVFETKGFKIAPNGIMSITGSKSRMTSHKHGFARGVTFGMLAAQASAAEEVAEALRRSQGLPQRMLMLGDDRSSHHRPQLSMIHTPDAVRIRDSLLKKLSDTTDALADKSAEDSSEQPPDTQEPKRRRLRKLSDAADALADKSTEDSCKQLPDTQEPKRRRLRKLSDAADALADKSTEDSCKQLPDTQEPKRRRLRKLSDTADAQE
eukprot:TRINITY_DN1757_c0_g1_i3.p1 TRINITY_DN1757_c0_g1~~TRINITY_DN1757_c0_g1_i3.p1  ORF type:complete len:527 (-),score=105.81 TRINITY_DN1757_c0_g1_i3:12-1592(-)